MTLPGELPRGRAAVRRPRLQMRGRCGAGCLPVTTGLRGRGPDPVNPGVHLPLTRSTPGFTALRRAGHTVNVASITRRRAQMTGPLGNLAKMALPGRLPFSRGDRTSRVGCVSPRPRLLSTRLRGAYVARASVAPQRAAPPERDQGSFGRPCTATSSTNASAPRKSPGLAVYSGRALPAAVAAIMRSEARVRGWRPVARTAAHICP